MRTVPLLWLTVTATALVARLMAAAAQCRAPKPLREGHVGGRAVQVAAGGLDRAVGRDDDRPVHLGDFLDPLADAGIVQVAFLAAVAA